MDFIEFYKTYWKDETNPINDVFLKEMNDLLKQSKKLVYSNGRPKYNNHSLFNLMQIAQALFEGKNIIVASHSTVPISLVEDLERFLNIKVSLSTTNNTGHYNLTLQNNKNNEKNY